MIYKLESSGDDVKTIQAGLRSLGFYKPPAVIDGYFGSTTDAAVREFQRVHGLAVDGVVGPKTWSQLLGPNAKASSPPSAVGVWASWLMRAQTDQPDPFPVERALKFIALESCGNPCATGRISGQHVMEAGLAQTYFETPDSVVHGFTSLQLRALCACEGISQHGGDCVDGAKLAHAEVAIADMKQHRARARAKLAAAGVELSEATPDFWAFVKLVHALPGLYSYLKPSGAQTWQDFKTWVTSRSGTELVAIDHGTARYAGAFSKVFKNCDEFAAG